MEVLFARGGGREGVSEGVGGIGFYGVAYHQ